MQKSWGGAGRPIERGPSGLFPQRLRQADAVELMLDLAERQVMQAVIESDAYAEVLIVAAPDRDSSGPAEPSVMLRFPSRFTGIAG